MDPIVVDPTDKRIDPHWLEQNRELGEQSHTRIPEHFRTAEITHPDVAAWVSRLADDALNRCRAFNPSIEHGRSLLILGITGTGKTHQAYGAIRALTLSGISARWRFITAADLYGQLRPRAGVDSERVFHEFATARLLALDDIGAAKGSEWVEEINYRLINHRYEHELPTIITSNLTPLQLRPELGERVASRLTEMTDRVVLEGKDRRRSR